MKADSRSEISAFFEKPLVSRVKPTTRNGYSWQLRTNGLPFHHYERVFEKMWKTP
jgi:hypothetical protein